MNNIELEGKAHEFRDLHNDTNTSIIVEGQNRDKRYTTGKATGTQIQISPQSKLNNIKLEGKAHEFRDLHNEFQIELDFKKRTRRKGGINLFNPSSNIGSEPIISLGASRLRGATDLFNPRRNK